MKRIPLWIIIAAAAVVASVMIVTYRRIRPKVIIGSATYTVEVAVTDAQKELGLGQRDSLADNHGMLFVYPGRGEYTFWMKGMRFPLDFIWIDGVTVVDITRNVPVDAGPNYRLYRPVKPADKILEVNAGDADAKGIRIGDTVRFKM